MMMMVSCFDLYGSRDDNDQETIPDLVPAGKLPHPVG